MLLEDYEAMGGHMAAMKPFKAVDPETGQGGDQEK